MMGAGRLMRGVAETSTNFGIETTFTLPAGTRVTAWARPHCRSTRSQLCASCSGKEAPLIRLPGSLVLLNVLVVLKLLSSASIGEATSSSEVYPRQNEGSSVKCLIAALGSGVLPLKLNISLDGIMGEEPAIIGSDDIVEKRGRSSMAATS